MSNTENVIAALKKYRPRRWEELVRELGGWVNGGAGTELKRLLSLHGINPDDEGCQCKERAKVMDRNGPDWCEANIETIVGWMKEEADRRGMPFVAMYARWLVRRAIKAARQRTLEKGAPATGS